MERCQHLIFVLIVLQNIDTLERIAGVPDERFVEAHGTFHTAHCMECKKLYPQEWVKRKVSWAQSTRLSLITVIWDYLGLKEIPHLGPVPQSPIGLMDEVRNFLTSLFLNMRRILQRNAYIAMLKARRTVVVIFRWKSCSCWIKNRDEVEEFHYTFEEPGPGFLC